MHNIRNNIAINHFGAKIATINLCTKIATRSEVMKCYKCNKNIQDKEKIQYGVHEKCYLEWFNLKNMHEFTKLFAHEGSDADSRVQHSSKYNSSFFQGKFKKYSAALNEIEYILKVEENDYPELPAVEYLCNQIASFLEINIPDFYYINFHNKKTFVNRNFINKNKRMTLHHFYHFFKESDQFDCKTIIEIIKQETGKIIDTDRFIEICLFDALIGNHDRHGRNLALIEHDGKKRLSPFYDNPTYLGIELQELLKAHHDPRGKIATSYTDEPTMKDYVKEFNDLNYQHVIVKFNKKVKKERIFQFIKDSFVSEERKEAIKKLVTRRIMELNDEL